GCEEGRGRCKRLWAQGEQLEQEPESSGPESAPMEIHYDRAVVKDFVSRLPEALRADVGLGREFLRETLQHVRVTDGGERRRKCPICDQTLGTITPQHLALHRVPAPPPAARAPGWRPRGGVLEVSRVGIEEGGSVGLAADPRGPLEHRKGVRLGGCGGRISTDDLWVMSPFQIESGANKPQTTHRKL